MAAHLIEDMSWPEFEAAMTNNDLVIVPTGSTEAHGPHSPLGTDSHIAEAVARQVGIRVAAPVAPAMRLGSALSLTVYPGTIHLEPELLRQVIVDVCRSLIGHGARRFLFVNGHGGNVQALRLAAADLFADFGVVAVSTEWWTTLPITSGIEVIEHGGLYETSMLMAAVGRELDLSTAEASPPRNRPAPGIGVEAGLTVDGVPVRLATPYDHHMPSGYHGRNVTDAGLELGQKVFAQYVDYCCQLAEDLRTIPLVAGRGLYQ